MPAEQAPGGLAAGALQARVRALLPSMTRSVQRVATAVAADPAGCAPLTVTGLAERTGTSEATVVRTARQLGYSGFRELRLALAAYAARQEVGPAVTDDIAVDDPLPDVVAKLARDEQRSLADTAAGLSADQLGAAVDALVAARRIDLYGVVASGLVAEDFAQKLRRIGLIGIAHQEVHAAVTSAVLLGPKDVAIGISHSGSTVEVLEPMRRAFEANATTIAITGHPRSPIAQFADHVLVASGRESELRPGAMASRISQLLVVDCLFVGVAQRTYPSTSRALTVSYEALAPRHVDPRRGMRPERGHQPGAAG